MAGLSSGGRPTSPRHSRLRGKGMHALAEAGDGGRDGGYCRTRAGSGNASGFPLTRE